jgi:hypothetical protein
MLLIVISFIISLGLLLGGFIGFVPNLQRNIESDLERRVISNTHLASMQYGQIALRAGTLTNGGTTGRAFVYPPRVNCSSASPTSCASMNITPTADQYLLSENGVAKSRVYSVLSYQVIGADPEPKLSVNTTIQGL